MSSYDALIAAAQAALAAGGKQVKKGSTTDPILTSFGEWLVSEHGFTPGSAASYRTYAKQSASLLAAGKAWSELTSSQRSGAVKFTVYVNEIVASRVETVFNHMVTSWIG